MGGKAWGPHSTHCKHKARLANTKEDSCGLGHYPCEPERACSGDNVKVYSIFTNTWTREIVNSSVELRYLLLQTSYLISELKYSFISSYYANRVGIANR